MLGEKVTCRRLHTMGYNLLRCKNHKKTIHLTNLHFVYNSRYLGSINKTKIFNSEGFTFQWGKTNIKQ